MKTLTAAPRWKSFPTLFLLLLPLLAAVGCGAPVEGTTDAGSGGTVSVPGSITLAWTPPETNVDGSPLTDLAGFRVHYGRASRDAGADYEVSVDVGNFTTCSLNLNEEGIWYFAVTAYDTYGNESNFSEELPVDIENSI